MKEYNIRTFEEGQRFDKFLAKVLKEAPKSFIYKMLRKKNIVLNEKKATGSESLKAGDVIKIYLADETFSKFSGSNLKENDKPAQVVLKSGEEANEVNEPNKANKQNKSDLLPEIVYEDRDILVLDKPAGLLSQKAKKNDYSANDFVISHMLTSGLLTREDLISFRPSICNRLDRNTSGLLLAGKSMYGLQMLGSMLKDRSLKKYYLCLVEGSLSQDAYLDGYLSKDPKKNKVTVSKNQTAGADRIETAYHPLECYGAATLLQVHLITGKSHQIRAHLASIGHPILGDFKYNHSRLCTELKAKTGIETQLLHAWKMKLPSDPSHPAYAGKANQYAGMELTANPPETFEKAITFLKGHK